MKFCVFASLFCLAFARDLVDEINSAQLPWKAGHNSRFDGLSKAEIVGLMGVRFLPKDVEEQYPLSDTRFLDVSTPDEFDARTQWPRCHTIGEIRDQSACGSCWAFGAVEAMSDRICIKSDQKLNVDLSADDLLSCCGLFQCGMGCNGGFPRGAWNFWVHTGIVTGSNYTQHHGCRPYPFPPCEHHIEGGHYKQCPKKIYPTPKCERKCQGTYHKDYNTDKFYGEKSYGVYSDQESIKKELMTNGPMEATLTVYEDFLTYKSGVYHHHTGGFLGGHAVRMLGWGTENGTPYWVIANSWNEDWGDAGFFKIKRGNNECGIESGLTGGDPKL